MAFTPFYPLTRERFGDLPLLCLDGAWGTEMQKLGAKPGHLAEEWNIDAPDKVLSVASAYVEAGANIILTNTFSANRILLERHGMADRAAEFARAGAAISRRAAEGRAYVFGSIGPCGKMVMMGEADPADVKAACAEQAAAMQAGGADALVIETQNDLVEAEAAIQGVREACDLPVGLSFTFDSGARRDRTMMGVTIAQACELARAQGASFAGANCGAGIETFVHIAEQFALCEGAPPIWIKGNAGLPEVDAEGRTMFKSPPQAFADAVEPLARAGARFIGGCCGSTPEHIRAIAAKIGELRA